MEMKFILSIQPVNWVIPHYETSLVTELKIDHCELVLFRMILTLRI